MSGKNAPPLFSPAANPAFSRMRRLGDRPFRPLKVSFPAALLLSLIWHLVLLRFFHYSYQLNSHLSQKTRAAAKRTREVIAKAVQNQPGIKRLLPTPDREKLADMLARGFQGSGKDIKAQIEALMGFLETLTESDSGNDPTTPEENLTLEEMLKRLLKYKRWENRRRQERPRHLTRKTTGIIYLISSIARKASCGTSIRPTFFIRFFPAFCFSSTFLFRE